MSHKDKRQTFVNLLLLQERSSFAHLNVALVNF